MPAFADWPACLQRNHRLRALAPDGMRIHALYGSFYLFLLPQDSAVGAVVDTVMGVVDGPHPLDTLLWRYPGFQDVALPVTPDLDAVLAARRRGRAGCGVIQPADHAADGAEAAAPRAAARAVPAVATRRRR